MANLTQPAGPPLSGPQSGTQRNESPKQTASSFDSTINKAEISTTSPAGFAQGTFPQGFTTLADGSSLREPTRIPSLMSHFTSPDANHPGLSSGGPMLPPLASVATTAGTSDFLPLGMNANSTRLGGLAPMLPPLDETGTMDLFGINNSLGGNNIKNMMLTSNLLNGNFTGSNSLMTGENALLDAASLPFFSTTNNNNSLSVATQLLGSSLAAAGGNAPSLNGPMGLAPNAGMGGSSEDEDEDDDALRNFLNSLTADQLIQLGKNVASVQKQKLNPQHHGHDMFKPYSLGPGSSRSHSGSASSSKLTPTRAPVLHQGSGGIQYIRFQYPNKGQHQEYSIRADIDNIEADQLPEDFKRENCVYPRAYCIFENYVGNRYEYETQVNDIAWRLTWLNRDVLAGKRGLIQRAVDNYRNLFRESRSRRVIRQDKITTGTLRRRSGDLSFPMGNSGGASSSLGGGPGSVNSFSPSPLGGGNSMLGGPAANMNKVSPLTVAASTLAGNSSNAAANSNMDMMTAMIQYEDRRGKIVQTKIRLNVDLVDTSMLMDEKFKLNNCLFPHAYHQALQYYNNPNQTNEPPDEMWNFECAMNELGWKLAYLNPSKLNGKKVALMAAIDAFRERFDPMQAQLYMWSPQT